MSRHYKPLEEAIEQIHDGLIGDVITAWAYRMHGPVGIGARQPGMKELAYQIANYSCFTWLNGSFIVDWLIHNIDVCCWVKNAWPVSVQGMGGRQVRKDADQLFDHYAAEYTFADGTRMVAQGRHMTNCYDFFGDIIHGTKGCGGAGRRPAQAAPLQGPPADLREPDLELQRRGRAITTRSSTTCSSTPSATTSPTTKPSAAPSPASPPSWAAWPANPAS